MKYTLELTEKQIQNMIIEYLNLSGHYVWRNNSGMVKMQNKDGSTRMWKAGVKGSSDIIGIAKNGRMIAIECKRPGKKMTQEQQWFLVEIKNRNGYAFVADSLEKVQQEGL